ncbi:MAG: acylphosphatase [Gammaproteobacteria bacterium]|jgi:acylphosphatase
MKRTITARVIGRVQAVYFRAATQIEANKLGITGYVCVEAEGNEENLEQFILWLHKGPKLAKVEQVIVESSEASDSFQGFDIRN